MKDTNICEKFAFDESSYSGLQMLQYNFTTLQYYIFVKTSGSAVDLLILCVELLIKIQHNRGEYPAVGQCLQWVSRKKCRNSNSEKFEKIESTLDCYNKRTAKVWRGTNFLQVINHVRFLAPKMKLSFISTNDF